MDGGTSPVSIIVSVLLLIVIIGYLGVIGYKIFSNFKAFKENSKQLLKSKKFWNPFDHFDIKQYIDTDPVNPGSGCDPATQVYNEVTRVCDPKDPGGGAGNGNPSNQGKTPGEICNEGDILPGTYKVYDYSGNCIYKCMEEKHIFDTGTGQCSLNPAFEALQTCNAGDNCLDILANKEHVRSAVLKRTGVGCACEVIECEPGFKNMFNRCVYLSEGSECDPNNEAITATYPKYGFEDSENIDNTVGIIDIDPDGQHVCTPVRCNSGETTVEINGIPQTVTAPMILNPPSDTDGEFNCVIASKTLMTFLDQAFRNEIQHQYRSINEAARDIISNSNKLLLEFETAWNNHVKIHIESNDYYATLIAASNYYMFLTYFDTKIKPRICDEIDVLDSALTGFKNLFTEWKRIIFEEYRMYFEEEVFQDTTLVNAFHTIFTQIIFTQTGLENYIDWTTLHDEAIIENINLSQSFYDHFTFIGCGGRSTYAVPEYPSLADIENAWKWTTLLCTTIGYVIAKGSENTHNAQDSGDYANRFMVYTLYKMGPTHETIGNEGFTVRLNFIQKLDPANYDYSFFKIKHPHLATIDGLYGAHYTVNNNDELVGPSYSHLVLLDNPPYLASAVSLTSGHNKLDDECNDGDRYYENAICNSFYANPDDPYLIENTKKLVAKGFPHGETNHYVHFINGSKSKLNIKVGPQHWYKGVFNTNMSMWADGDEFWHSPFFILPNNHLYSTLDNYVDRSQHNNIWRPTTSYPFPSQTGTSFIAEDDRTYYVNADNFVIMDVNRERPHTTINLQTSSVHLDEGECRGLDTTTGCGVPKIYARAFNELRRHGTSYFSSIRIHTAYENFGSYGGKATPVVLYRPDQDFVISDSKSDGTAWWDYLRGGDGANSHFHPDNNNAPWKRPQAWYAKAGNYSGSRGQNVDWQGHRRYNMR